MEILSIETSVRISEIAFALLLLAFFLFWYTARLTWKVRRDTARIRNLQNELQRRVNALPPGSSNAS